VILLYEYLEGKDLKSALEYANKAHDLTWQRRLSILCGLAKALEYLHHRDKNDPTYHRDVKSSNVGLTANFGAKLIDCGLAKLSSKTAADRHSQR
jgi:serine/threonine protein kinase